MRTVQVFVSHTSDMARFPPARSFVQAALDAVARAGLAPVDMQYFAAREGKPADYCRQRVRDCEVYLAVVGFRYGSLAPDETVSYTELEFQEATATGKPRLVFLLDETADPPADPADTDGGAVAAFRQRLREAGLIVATFTSVDGLELEVFHALKEVVGTRSRNVPRQLPAAATHFAGRSTELAALTGLMREHSGAGGTVVISAIGGMAGVGKTALALYWAHQVAHRFPEGQLYVNLRGFDLSGTIMDPAEAIRRFLAAIGVHPQRIPADPDAQAALYRSELAGRRMLIVLDNARTTAQVRPLLPGAPGCLVLVTSRHQLSGLVAADGAHPITLDLLTPDEAREMLVRRLGPDRTAAEPDTVDQLITACARLPLALAIVAARAATHPHLPLHTLARELRDAGARLDALITDDPHTDVRAVFSWSYRTLTSDAARLFRLLGLHPGPVLSVPAAASLTALTQATVRPMLAELSHAHLITEHTPGRFAFHDLLRAYATELAHTTDPAAQRRAAVHRTLDHYLHTAHAATQLLYPYRDPITLALAHAGVTQEDLADQGQALAWLTAEHPVLLAAIRQAADHGFDIHTWQLAWTLDTFFARQGHRHDWAAAQHIALDAARRSADRIGQAHAHQGLARAYTRLGRYDDAYAHYREALNLFGELGDRTGQARTHRNLGFVLGLQGRHAEALDHAQQSLDLFRTDGHRAGQAHALNSVGWYYAQLGDHRQALAHCQRALTLHQEIGDRDGEAAAWDSLGYANHHLGLHQQAVLCYLRAIDLIREIGGRYSEADVLSHLGDTHHAAGSPEAARVAWQQALIILDDLDHPDAEEVRNKLGGLG
jgi:tetratricopeptide (TPR) repeat protein